jgi:hypothetical protein
LERNALCRVGGGCSPQVLAAIAGSQPLDGLQNHTLGVVQLSRTSDVRSAGRLAVEDGDQIFVRGFRALDVG